MTTGSSNLRLIAERALEFIHNDQVVGLGSGRAATQFIQALGERVRAGLRVRGVATSRATWGLAAQLGIPMTSLDEVEVIDVAVDGADEVDPQRNLIKGLGGALVREKIVAAAARQFVVLVTPDKLVPRLGTRGPDSRGVLPVEVVSFGLSFCRRRLAALGVEPVHRFQDGRPFVTDNSNDILDCRLAGVPTPLPAFEAQLLAIPGVVGTGLFLDMNPTVLVQDGDTVQLRQRSEP